MNQALMIVDVQRGFTPPPGLIAGITRLLPLMPSIATVERHVESKVPFQRQLGWHPSADDDSLVVADRLFVKHGYLPPVEAMDHLRDLGVARVLVCGIQAETCVLAAGFALFDAGLHPTLIADLAVGSSLDPSGGLGVRLWRHQSTLARSWSCTFRIHANVFSQPQAGSIRGRGWRLLAERRGASSEHRWRGRLGASDSARHAG